MWERAKEFQAGDSAGSRGVERGLVCGSQGDQPSQTDHTEGNCVTLSGTQGGGPCWEEGVHMWLGALGGFSAPNIGPLQLHVETLFARPFSMPGLKDCEGRQALYSGSTKRERKGKGSFRCSALLFHLYFLSRDQPAGRGHSPCAELRMPRSFFLNPRRAAPGV